MGDTADIRAPAALIVLAVLIAAAPASAGTSPLHADAALDRGLRGLVQTKLGPPGAIAVVQRNRQLRIHTAGVGQVKPRRLIQITDRMRLASTAKAFSGAVALSLVSRGSLSLTDTIGSRLPALPAAWSAVTLAQLLHHTSGLPDFSNDAMFLAQLRADLHHRFDSRTLWRYVAGEPLRFTPGSAYRYSNTDNIVVALMTEAATGKRYESLLAQRVSHPLGLTRTSLPDGFLIASPFIHGYDVAARGRLEDISTAIGASGAWASGGIVSTPADLNRFARGYVGARLFSRAVQARQLQWVPGTSEPPGPGANSAGLAIFRYRTRCGTVYGHTGNTPGYTQFLAATLDGRRSVTVSVNEQLTQKQKPAVWRVLRRVEETAVCAALAR